MHNCTEPLSSQKKRTSCKMNTTNELLHTRQQNNSHSPVLWRSFLLKRLQNLHLFCNQRNHFFLRFKFLLNIGNDLWRKWKLNYLPQFVKMHFPHQLFFFRLNHVTGVWLPSQSASPKHNQEKKPTNLCAPREFLQKCVCHV